MAHRLHLFCPLSLGSYHPFALIFLSFILVVLFIFFYFLFCCCCFHFQKSYTIFVRQSIFFFIDCGETFWIYATYLIQTSAQSSVPSLEPVTDWVNLEFLTILLLVVVAIYTVKPMPPYTQTLTHTRHNTRYKPMDYVSTCLVAFIKH